MSLQDPPQVSSGVPTNVHPDRAGLRRAGAWLQETHARTRAHTCTDSNHFLNEMHGGVTERVHIDQGVVVLVGGWG